MNVEWKFVLVENKIKKGVRCDDGDDIWWLGTLEKARVCKFILCWCVSSDVEWIEMER